MGAGSKTTDHQEFIKIFSMQVIEYIIGLLILIIIIWKIYQVFKYLTFKIAVLENIIGHLLPGEDGNKIIRRSVKDVLMSDWEYKKTIRAIKFVGGLGDLETYDKIEAFDPSDAVDEIVKIHKSS